MTLRKLKQSQKGDGTQVVGGFVRLSFHRKGSKFKFRASLDPKNTATGKQASQVLLLKMINFCKKNSDISGKAHW
jgi:hypothetical protein